MTEPRIICVDDWPEPREIGADLLAVPTFNPEHLPESLRPLVEDVSDRMKTPPDFAAIAATICLSGCVGRRALIRPKLLDTGWAVVPNLWGAIVAPPGYMKSPLLNAIAKPLFYIHEKWLADYKSEAATFEVEKEQAELRHQAWREQFKSASKKNQTISVQPDASMSEPTKRQLIITDATYESLHLALSSNPSGITVVRDELVGLFGDLDKPGRESDRSFYLACWAGDTPHLMTRIGRGDIHVPACCINLVGNIQPTRLRHYLTDMLEGGRNDDGLFARLQLLTWPESTEWALTDRAPNAKAIMMAADVFQTLAELSSEFPLNMRFAPQAQSRFFEWWTDLEEKVRGVIHPALCAHLSKYRSLMPSLAGLFELADRVVTSVPTDDVIDISLAHAEQAVNWCTYLEAHARRTYATITSPAQLAAIELSHHISAGKVPNIFSARTIYRKHWSQLDTSEKVSNALDVLEDAGWIRTIAEPISEAGGRPTELFEVHPKFHHQGENR
ncbi:MAG TPA: YfjI family protein [Candidatus Acidoferrales bacterium]|jgi:hypothetical protein|nr:YfjI family protein [Candidatus Acidoferrales bacterium]